MNIAFLSAGYVSARLFTGRIVIIVGWRHVHVKAPKKEGKRDPDEWIPKDWIGPALCLEFEDGSRHHGYDPSTIVETFQTYHGIKQAREATFKSP